MPGEIIKNSLEDSLLSRLYRRTSLTLKMVFMAVVVALVMWAGYDHIQTRELQKIFRAQLSERLGMQAMEDRIRFDRYVKAHLHSIKLFISQDKFSQYIGKQKWSSGDSIEIKSYRKSPRWFPRSSVLRTFGQPRFALLFDSKGNLREVYSGLRNDKLPESLMRPSQRLLLISHGQNYMTNLDGRPYLIASETYTDEEGKAKAILMLASPIDDMFLSTAIGSSKQGHVVALLTSAENPRILTSSNPARIKTGASLKTLEEDYLVTGKEFFDYGASEQAIKFVSLISMDEVQMLIKSITSKERKLRIIGLPILIAAFALLMFWVTWRIQIVTANISEFSERTLGIQSIDQKKGDQLYMLEQRFQRLTEEVLEAREVQRRQSEEERLLEKKNMEIEQKEKQLMLLQSVTQAVGIGVAKKTDDGLKAINDQMEQFAEVCGGLNSFAVYDPLNEEHALKDKEGKKHIFHISCPDIFKGERIYLVRDITKAKEQTSALEHMALHDSLTDLPNRTLLLDRLQQAILIGQRESRQVALLMMDLDRFKEINDTLGHHIGDMILKDVGIRLPAMLRKSDTIARLGGDEFAVVLPSTEKNYALQIAKKLLEVLEEPFVIEGHNLYVGASIGIALFPDNGKDPSTLLQRVDVAMYVAKNAHNGIAMYSPEDDRHDLQHLVLMGDLRRAIENDELSLVYQPKIDYKSDSIYGTEALIRWQHRDRGFISPGEFIPLAERTGLIMPLTLWVLNTAMKQYKEWHYELGGIDINMSVNLSARNLLDLQFPMEVEEILKIWEIEPSRLELEITESAVMEDPEHARQILEHLDELGVRLSIDDFGTGYTSLGQLKKLPVDEIKIDRGFVMNMVTDESDAVIVRSTIDLAHNLGLTVVAEGVETEEVMKALEKLGCDGAQGFYMGRPLTPDKFVEWLHESPWGLYNRTDREVTKSLPLSEPHSRGISFSRE